MKRSSSVNIEDLAPFYESNEYNSHCKLIRHDLYVEYLFKHSADKTLLDKDSVIELIEKFQIKNYSYDVQTEKPNADTKHLYYDLITDPSKTSFARQVRGVKPKNASGYEYREEKVSNGNEINLPERLKYKSVCVGFILENTKRIVVKFF